MGFRLQVKPDPVKYNPPKSKSTIVNATKIVDWDSFLHSYWLEKMASSNSSFYDDAKILHRNGCRCCINTSTNVRSRNLREVTKRK